MSKKKQQIYHNTTLNIQLSTCSNCGSYDHIYKYCKEPITSWGIILVTYGSMNKPEHCDTHFSTNNKIDLTTIDMTENKNRVLIESKTDRIIVGNVYHNIRFLLISRKHSLGYVEFIRGRYKPEKIDHIIYLFKQMKQVEIDKIAKSLEREDGFEFLWSDFWTDKADSIYLSYDKKQSLSNYNILKSSGIDGPDINLSFIVANVKAEFNIDEWGFPKGRKEKNESDEDCALREFAEETGYKKTDINIIDTIEPLVEEFIGTNGIKYRHVYYVAEFTNENLTFELPKNNEIGDMKFMDFTTALTNIRQYHLSRKAILERLFVYYLDKLILSNRKSN